MTVTMPEPPHAGQATLSMWPEPPQRGQRPSALCALPGGVSSPGRSGGSSDVEEAVEADIAAWLWIGRKDALRQFACRKFPSGHSACPGMRMLLQTLFPNHRNQRSL